MTNPQGRPTAYTEELGAEICARLSEGATLRAVCKADDMPPESTVRKWALQDRGGFGAQYAIAREIGWLCMADEVLDIADDSSGDTKTDKDGNATMDGEWVARSRLRLDTRKWLLSKALPKIYGDKIAVGGADDLPPIKTLSKIERVIVDHSTPKAKVND
jgi:hypothetical protein